MDSSFGLDMGASDWHPGLWQPTSVADCEIWCRSDQGITLNGSDVSQWDNIASAGAHDFVQATPSQQPEYVTTGPWPFLRFVAANSQQMVSTAVNALIASSPFSIFVVAACSAGGIHGTNSGTFRFRIQRTSASYVNLNNLTFAGTSDWALYHFLHDGTDAKLRRDGVELDSVTVALSALDTAALLIGRAGATYGDVDIAEYWLYSRALTAAEIAANESYGRGRYNL